MLPRWLIVALLVVQTIGLRAASATEDPDVEIARRHFVRGTELYDKADYAQAVVEFRLARAIKARPELDYNIARCYDRMEKVDDAIVAYERFVGAATDSASLTEVRERLRVLSLRVRSETASPVAPRQSPARRYGLSIGIGVGAVVVAATAIGLIASVAGPYHDLELGPCAMGCDASRYAGLESRAHAAYGLFGVAGALAIVDVAAIIVAARSPR